MSPIRAEQNQRAQAKFRQRKKDKLSDMERQLAAMSSQMERLLEEKEAYAEHAFRLQQAVDQKEAQLSTLKGEAAGVAASEELVNAFWEMVTELSHANAGLGCSRGQVADMVHGLLNWRAPDLGFIRKARRPAATGAAHRSAGRLLSRAAAAGDRGAAGRVLPAGRRRGALARAPPPQPPRHRLCARRPPACSRPLGSSAPR